MYFSKIFVSAIADVAQKLWELEFTIHKVKISTSPDGKAVNLFFVTDNRYRVFAKTLYSETKFCHIIEYISGKSGLETGTFK